MANRGSFAQRLMARTIKQDSRKDGFVWALRLGGVGADANKFEDVRFDVSPREVTTSEATRYGKSELLGGIKLTIPAHICNRITSLGMVGPITEEVRIVRGTDFEPAVAGVSRAHVSGQEDHFNIQHVHPVHNNGVVQEYWIYVQPEEGGPTRG